MIDYEEIIEELDVERIKDLLHALGVGFKEQDDCLICQTACHNADLGDASYKLYFYFDSKIFYCYTECGAMSVFSFLKNFYEARDIEYDWYNDIYKVILDCSNYSLDYSSEERYKSVRALFEKKQTTVALPLYDECVLDCFIKYYPVEWLQDGITKEAMDKFGIKYSISQNKIVIPHRNYKGQLVGIRGRALDEWEVENIGKYLPMCVENTWYKHPLGLNLYGLYENMNNIKEAGIVYVCESEKAVLQAESFSTPNCCVAVCGSNFNKFVLKLLIKLCHPKEIVICFDNEEKPGEEKYLKKLWGICQKYKNYCQFSFVYDSKGLTKLKDSPTDRGEEIFRKLIDERIVVR